MIEVSACAFAVALFAGLAAASVVPLPIPRYDALLLYAIAVTVVFRLLRLESSRELLVIAGFHVVGLAFELAKVRLGSWSYPEEAYTKIGGVPLYSGFLYAAVGSYVCRAWRLFDLRLVAYRTRTTALVATAIYINFIAHHWFVDLRVPLALALLLATWGTVVHFTVGEERYRMPLALALALIGFFLWVAENLATYLGAWTYPDQAETWHLVHPAKFGAWALLVSVSFTQVAALKALQGRLHHPTTTAHPRWALPVSRLSRPEPSSTRNRTASSPPRSSGLPTEGERRPTPLAFFADSSGPLTSIGRHNRACTLEPTGHLGVRPSRRRLGIALERAEQGPRRQRKT
ncbi:hypothetical protein GCM10010439_05140 [Actinocorallia aurantiaca]|uniref:DUF817 domain-containing protein n=1 Tax=Actinocorallia aurantiaca TaxID=46204 RepID=A0ABP6G9L0_9ACTN